MLIEERLEATRLALAEATDTIEIIRLRAREAVLVEREIDEAYWLMESCLDIVEDIDLGKENRMKLAKKGVAMAHGGFPIPNTDYLKRAVKAFGRAKDKTAAKAHIKKRAKALGATHLLPDTWGAAAA